MKYIFNWCCVYLVIFHKVKASSECQAESMLCEPLQFALNYYITAEDLCHFEEIQVQKALSNASELKKSRYKTFRNTFDILCEKYEKTGEGNRKKLAHLKNGIYNLLGISLNRDSAKLGFNCPPAEEISPCSCIVNELTTLNCSAVGSFIKMKNILTKATFPSTKFDKFLYIPQSPSDEEAVLFNDSFGSLSFEQIYISETGLQELQEDAFISSINTLKFLMMDSNHEFEKFPFTSMDNYQNLLAIDITDSIIEAIPIVSNIECLTVFSLPSNKISSLKKNSFTGLPSLSILDLGYNQLKSIFALGGLSFSSTKVYITIDYNLLTTMSAFSCYQPYILDESHNNLLTFKQDIYKPILEEQQSVINTINNTIDCTQYEWVQETYTNYDERVITDCWNELKK